MAEDQSRLYKIGEVCKLADVQPYVLRYWETEFPPLAPNKSGGGQRLYSQHEIDIILRIKQFEQLSELRMNKKQIEKIVQKLKALVVRIEKAESEITEIEVKIGLSQKDLTKALVDVQKELRAILQMLE